MSSRLEGHMRLSPDAEKLLAELRIGNETYSDTIERLGKFYKSACWATRGKP